MTNTETVSTDDGTALALFIELGAYFDPKLTEHDKSIVLSKIRSRTSRTQSPAEWQVERTITGETVNGIPVLGWLTYNDIPGVGVTPRVDFHWSTPGEGKDVIRLVDAEALRAASIPAPERSKEEVGVKAFADAILDLAKDGVAENDLSFNSGLCAALEAIRPLIDAALETTPLHKEGEASIDRHAYRVAHLPYPDAAPVPVPVTITDEWPEAPEGWQRTKPTYVRSDGTLRVEFIYGRERSPWCVSWSLGNGACASLSYHATPQEALDAALATKVTGDATGTAAALSLKPGEQG